MCNYYSSRGHAGMKLPLEKAPSQNSPTFLPIQFHSTSISYSPCRVGAISISSPLSLSLSPSSSSVLLSRRFAQLRVSIPPAAAARDLSRFTEGLAGGIEDVGSDGFRYKAFRPGDPVGS
jgi:hypothetical protein